MARNLTVRLLALPITALTTFAFVRLAIENLGVHEYGLVALIATLPALFPFLDLGIGLAVQSAVANRTPGDEGRVEATLITSARTLMVVGFTLATIGVIGGSLGMWSSLLEPTTSGLNIDFAVTATVCVWAIGIPLALGQRVLVGIGRTTVVFLSLGAVGPTGLFLAWVIIVADLPPEFWTLCMPVAALVPSTVSLIVAAFYWRGRLLKLIKSVPRLRGFGGLSVRVATAGFVVTVGLPLMLQSHRLLLNYYSSPTALAEYAIVAQLYIPAWSVLSAAGMALWPKFAQQRARGGLSRRSYKRQAEIVFAVAAVGAGIMIIGGPLGVHLLSGGALSPPFLLYVSFAMLLLAQGLQLPSGMWLSDQKGLRFQAICVTLAAPISLLLGGLLAPSHGASGPVLASAVVVAVLLAAPGAMQVLRLSPRPVGAGRTDDSSLRVDGRFGSR